MGRHHLLSTHLEDEATILDCYDPSLVAAVYNLSSKVHAHYEPGFLAVLEYKFGWIYLTYDNSFLMC